VQEKNSIFRIYPHSSPLGALSTACFAPVTTPSPATAGFLAAGPARNSSAVRRESRRIGGATGGTASRQRLSGASDRWKFVSKRPAIRDARAAPCAPTSCFTYSREASSLLAQSSPWGYPIPLLHAASASGSKATRPKQWLQMVIPPVRVTTCAKGCGQASCFAVGAGIAEYPGFPGACCEGAGSSAL
jgi:hypothetical protein